MIVAIEGLDAAGKQMQSRLLAGSLRGTRFSFPNYDSPTGRLILSHLKKEWEARVPVHTGGHENEPHINALVFQSLQIVNRIEMLPSICEAHARGPVVFDRYWQSAVVYGVLDGLDEEWLERVQRSPMLHANVSILIDIPVEESFRRRPERRDRFEADRPFLEKVRAKYLELFVRNSEKKPEHWRVVDGLGDLTEVHERIMRVVSGWRAG